MARAYLARARARVSISRTGASVKAIATCDAGDMFREAATAAMRVA